MMSGGSAGRVAKIALDSVLKSGGRTTAGGWLLLLSTLPVKAWQWYALALRDHGLMTDSLTTMCLYLLGQGTLGIITGKMQPLRVIIRWMFFGLLDGTMTHWWYHLSEGLSTVVVPGAGLPRVGVQLLMTSLFYTPLYCLLFVVTSAIWDGLGLKGIVEKVKTEGKTLIIGTVPTWTVINVFLFIWVSRTYRVLIAELFHYVYLIGLALWELSIIKAKKGEDTDTILEVLEGDAKKGDEPLVHPTPEGGVIFAPSQAGPSPEGAVVLPDGVVLASRQDGLDPRA